MYTRFAAFVLMLTLVGIARLYPHQSGSNDAGLLTLSFGMVILSGYLLGELLVHVKLPRISGYLITGMILGPFGVKFITESSIQNFALIDQIALALIALTAGGELHFSSIQRRWRGIACLTFFQISLVFLLSSAVFFYIIQWLPVLSTLPISSRVGASMVFGIIATAQSPADDRRDHYRNSLEGNGAGDHSRCRRH